MLQWYEITVEEYKMRLMSSGVLRFPFSEERGTDRLFKGPLLPGSPLGKSPADWCAMIAKSFFETVDTA